MIYVVEPKCKGWEHEKVNSGFLKQLNEALPYKRIHFFADSSHVECVNKIFDLAHLISTNFCQFIARLKSARGIKNAPKPNNPQNTFLMKTPHQSHDYRSEIIIN